ncbi:MAG: TetR/AcrR family transcriptional regulator [Lachnospiraceae bacterium]|nr:TetR/AcrR family transcriptional regulator [Lachnospiraceae bacterium]MDE7286341.1 TetR/AcrR family transcriptional regulator [Lachnospiraceae bacterium]
MGKIDLNKKRKREALLNTAFELFTTQGINKTTINNIVETAGVAKGTFYLYFKDKYDIRNKLIAHKASCIFSIADAALSQTGLTELDDRIIFLVDNIIEQFNADKSLLNFISKNLSWGIFKNELISSKDDSEVDFYNIYTILENSPKAFKNPEILLFMIVEFVSSTCYSSILYHEPTGIEELKPYIFDAIRQIMKSQEIRPK